MSIKSVICLPGAKKDPDVRKGELMDAAERLFIENGYEHTSASDIIKKTDVAQGTFYHYFKDKDDILDAVIDRYFEGFSGRLALVANSDKLDARQKLQMLLDILLAVKDIRLETRISKHEKYQEYIERSILPPITQILTEGADGGEFDIKYPAETAELLLLIFQHLKDRAPSVENEEIRDRKIKAARAAIERCLGVKKKTFRIVYGWQGPV